MLSFPPFRIDLESERLWKNDEPVHLRRKPFAILCHLARNPRRLVTHEEIIEAVWGRIATSASLLRTHIHDLRHALGDDVVETVPGRGYRFVADVRSVDGEALPDASAAATAESSRRALVGRDAELEALAEALRAVGEGRRGAVFLTGEAGVGKTALVDLFIARAPRPLLVGRGASVERHGGGQAYLPVLDAIGALCRGRSGDRVVEVMARHAPSWLVQLPGLLRDDRLADLQRRAAGATRAGVLRELAEALETLSLEAPVVVVLEDLQWTDPSVVELLAIVGTRREPARILVLGTYRPAEVTRGHPLARVVGELVAHRQATSIPVGALGADTLEAYLHQRFPGHAFPRGLAGALHRSTGGNPLFLTTLIDDLEHQGVIHDREGRWTLSTSVEDVAARRPDGIVRLVDAQIDRLSPTEQRVLEVASVVGTAFTAGLVALALEADPDGVDSCCESLAGDRGLLQYLGTETWPDGTIHSRYGFRNALLRHAALARSTSAQVRALHRRITERLEAG
jgi:DNA-binding winged helix-turn-helix (wHTH) protein